MLQVGWRLAQRLLFLPLLAFSLAASVGCTSPEADSNLAKQPSSPATNQVVAESSNVQQEDAAIEESVKEDLALGISQLEEKEYDSAIKKFCLVLGHNHSKQTEDAGTGGEVVAVAVESRGEELKALKKDALYYRGVAFLEKGFANTAVEDFNEVLQMDRQDARTFVQRGRAHAELAAWYEAVRDCTRAIRLDPSSGMAYYYRGWAYLNWDKCKLAVADLEEAVRLEPNYAEEAKQHIGSAYQSWYDQLRTDGDQEKADEVYMQAREVLTAMTELAGSGSGEDSNARYFVAKPITVEVFDTHYQEGLRLFNEGELVEAIAELNRAIQLDPDHAEAFFHNGIAHLERGFPNTAVAYFKKAEAKGLKSSQLYSLMAEAYDDLDEDLLVPRYATQAIMLDSANAEAYRIRAMSYIKSSEMALAKRDLEEAVRLAPAMKDEINLLMKRIPATAGRD